MDQFLNDIQIMGCSSTPTRNISEHMADQNNSLQVIYVAILLFENSIDLLDEETKTVFQVKLNWIFEYHFVRTV